jgi:hypothetical protein
MKIFSRKFWAGLGLSMIIMLNLAVFTPVAWGANASPPPIIPNGAVGDLKIPHDTTGDSPNSYLQNRLLPGIAQIVISIAGGIALVMAIFSGIQLLTTYGNPAQAESAKKTLTYALVGIVVAGLSYAIVAIIAAINIP